MIDDFDIRGLPPAKQQLWQKLAQIDVDGIARKEKALAELAARIEEVAAAIPPAETKAEAAEAKAKAGAHDAASAKRELQALVQERDRLARRRLEDMHELARKRDELAAFCKRKGIEARPRATTSDDSAVEASTRVGLDGKVRNMPSFG
jgi:uncharacterized coiled-coil DUF342 family protein